MKRVLKTRIGTCVVSALVLVSLLAMSIPVQADEWDDIEKKEDFATTLAYVAVGLAGAAVLIGILSQGSDDPESDTGSTSPKTAPATPVESEAEEQSGTAFGRGRAWIVGIRFHRRNPGPQMFLRASVNRA